MTDHNAGMDKLAGWLRHEYDPIYMVREPTVKGIDEQPDFLLVLKTGGTMLVEYKASREDAIADRGKPFRQNPRLGMGNYRAMVSPVGVSVVVPDGWAHVIEYDGRYSGDTDKDGMQWHHANINNERKLLASICRRLEQSSGREHRDTRGKRKHRLNDEQKECVNDYIEYAVEISAREVARHLEEQTLSGGMKREKLIDAIIEYVNEERPMGFGVPYPKRSPVMIVQGTHQLKGEIVE